MIKKSRQQFKYLENKKRFEDEINSIPHHFFKGPSLEVVSQRSFVKNVYKQISQNSCARVSFLIKLQVTWNFIKKGIGTSIFLWILWNL